MAAPTRAIKGLTYWLGSSFYVSLTNRCNSTSLIAARGPSFEMPKESGFCFLPDDYEPSAQDVSDAVHAAYATDDRKVSESMGESDEGVIFAGAGEPLLRLDELTEACRNIKEERHGVPLRVNTNGLVLDAESVVNALKESGVGSVSVLMLGANPKQYAEFMQPADGLEFGHACSFVCAAVEGGIDVTCTTVQRPEINVSDVRALAMGLGAIDFKVRSFHP